MSAPRKHILTEVDEENRRAVCAHCGPTRIVRRQGALRCATLKSKKLGEAGKARKREAARKSHRRLRYGLTDAAFEIMSQRQGGACAICGSVPERGLHVDHSHDDGHVRGLLCMLCNTGLGHFGDSPERLRAAIAYLERPRPASMS